MTLNHNPRTVFANPVLYVTKVSVVNGKLAENRLPLNDPLMPRLKRFSVEKPVESEGKEPVECRATVVWLLEVLH